MSYYAFVLRKPDGSMKVIRPTEVSWTLVLGKERSYFTLDELLNLPDFKKATAKKKLEALNEGQEFKTSVKSSSQDLPVCIYRLTTQNQALLEESVKVSTELDEVLLKIKNSVPVELIESKKNLTSQLKGIKKMAKTMDANVILKL